MEHARYEELAGCNKWIADEGYVLTNYKAGDDQMQYSSTIIFAKNTNVDDFYALDISTAENLYNEIHKNDKIIKKSINENLTEE